MTIYTDYIPHRLACQIAGFSTRLLGHIRNWRESLLLSQTLRKERRQLISMSDEMLTDIGISRAEAAVEARRTDTPSVRRKSS